MAGRERSPQGRTPGGPLTAPYAWHVTIAQVAEPIEASSVTARLPLTTMTTLPGVSRPRLRALTTIGVHFVIDAFSFVVVALLPLLVVTLSIPTKQKAILLGIGSVSSGVIQPVVAWFSDRFDTRLLSTTGFVVAVLAISNVGMASSFGQLAVLYAVGAMGVGAFHPPAAAAVGRLAGPRRSRYIALFFLAGMLGGMVGNVFTPGIVETAARIETGINPQLGLDFLRWFMIPGLLCAVLLHLSIRSVGHRGSNSGVSHDSWGRAEIRARWGAVFILYVSNILRFTVNMALVYLFSEWAQRQTLDAAGTATMTGAIGATASGLNGRLQGAMQIGMGTGGLLLGFVLSARHEKAVFWLFPTLGAVAITAISFADGLSIAMPLAMLGSALAGAGFGACVPVSMALAQRMLPHRTSLASGLMLGGAWAFAFVGPLTAEWVQNKLAGGLGLDAAFHCTAAALFIAGLITLALPRDLMRRTHAD